MGLNIMPKKDVLKKASDRIADADTTAVAQHDNNADATPIETAEPTDARPTIKLETTPAAGLGSHLGAVCKICWAAIKRGAHYIFVRVPTMFWNWVRGINIVGLGNCALLLAIIVMFSLLIGRAWNTLKGTNDQRVAQITKPQATAARTAPRTPQPVTVNVPANVTVSASTDSLTITLPLQRIVQPAIKSGNIVAAATQTGRQPVRMQAHRHPNRDKGGRRPLVANAQIHGDKIIDGAEPGNARLKPDTRIRGNLFLQNHRNFTLPCGLHVDGDLYLRNVGLLRFCNDFTVTGNIYVNRNSSFGPIPRTAHLGGQVIF
jgi:hypothetical protein